MIDKSGQGSGEPAVAGFLIVPSDTQGLPFVPRAIYIGVSGNLALMTFMGDVLIFTGVVAGSVLPIRAIKVFSTNTTAGNLIGLY